MNKRQSDTQGKHEDGLIDQKDQIWQIDAQILDIITPSTEDKIIQTHPVLYLDNGHCYRNIEAGKGKVERCFRLSENFKP